MPQKIEITPKSIIWFLVILVVGWLLYVVRDIIALLFIAYILMTALRPGVERLEKLRIPRLIALVITYVIVIGSLFGVGRLIFPPLVTETIRLFNALPYYITQITPFINVDISTIIQQIAPIGQNVARFTVAIFSNIITIFTIVVFTFYFLLEHNNLRTFLASFIGDEWGNRIFKIFQKIEERLGAWVRGQILLATIIGILSYIGLTILGIHYPLPLALIAGILEVVPILGPIIAGFPAVLVALTISPGLALGVVGLYFLIQQVENNILVPAVMKKATGIAPLASLIALMIGGRLGGILGIVLSVPILLVVQTLFAELLYKKTPKEM